MRLNKTLAIILARGGSKGIKNKNIIKLNTKPLVYWSIKSCLASKLIDSVWVSSDSKKILKIAEKYGAKTIMRPERFSKDESSSETAWLHAVKFLQNKISFKTIVGIQPTSPIRPSKFLDEALKKYKKKNLIVYFLHRKFQIILFGKKRIINYLQIIIL